RSHTGHLNRRLLDASAVMLAPTHGGANAASDCEADGRIPDILEREFAEGERRMLGRETVFLSAVGGGCRYGRQVLLTPSLQFGEGAPPTSRDYFQFPGRFLQAG